MGTSIKWMRGQPAILGAQRRPSRTCLPCATSYGTTCSDLCSPGFETSEPRGHPSCSLCSKEILKPHFF